jgi:hypothetical protein
VSSPIFAAAAAPQAAADRGSKAPASQELQAHYLMLAYTQSVVADRKTIAWLKAGGSRATEPWQYHAKVSETKAKLVQLLLKTAGPLGIPVPQATNIYP